MTGQLFTGEMMDIHEICTIFPMMNPAEFRDLVTDVAKHGQREPIWTFGGKVIDGRNRLRACKEMGIEPKTREWSGEGSLLDFVLSLNLHRRHLDESQRAMVAAKIKPMFEEEAKARQATSSGGADPQLRANLPEADKGRARDKAAETMAVSPRSVESAAKVIRQGVPDLVQQVEQGEVKVSTAAIVAGLPDGEQVAIVAAGPRATRERAAEIRRAKKVPASQVEILPADKPAPDSQSRMRRFNWAVEVTAWLPAFPADSCEEANRAEAAILDALAMAIGVNGVEQARIVNRACDEPQVFGQAPYGFGRLHAEAERGLNRLANIAAGDRKRQVYSDEAAAIIRYLTALQRRVEGSYFVKPAQGATSNTHATPAAN